MCTAAELVQQFEVAACGEISVTTEKEASLTAAIVARSLWAAECSSWAVGVLVGWVVVRRELIWPVSWDVVVAVDMKWFLFLGWREGTEAGKDGRLAPRIRP